VPIFSGRNKPGRFVQHDRESRSGSNELAGHLDVITRARLCAEVCANFTVNGDATRRYQLITMSPRANASSGEETVQAHNRDS
jgi:hypothetical protein